MLELFKKLIPFQHTEEEKPMHAGEVYHLWEGLTGGYKLIEEAEMYLMNTEDPELQLLLKALTTGIFLVEIRKIEDVLKNEGFTVPPRPVSKLKQGAPGTGQEVKLTDKEVVKIMVSQGQIYIMFNARAVMASSRESIRKIFKNLMGEHIIAYKAFIKLGKQRNVFDIPPAATVRQNALNMAEVGVIWDELTARHLSQVNLETYLASIQDNDLIKLIKWGLNGIVFPQMEKLENILKSEGFSIPPRPPIRTEQYSPGQINKIRASDDETLGVLTLAFQSAIIMHSRALMTILRDDIFSLFKSFLYKEFEGYEKLMSLAKSRFVLDNPPKVSSIRM
ncbi:hypothetical protein Dtox_2537 [Desulfofarcimen acetoxidans DSM 771]|uniref:DUF3231 family protein n=1 Tax=Desulfofarcimen acetoxidans (strain ATCC 49208 / DSM 771 / KCTC 5769 / VKM B-1644 / 5575) TaxID=485916 RepID=C8W0T4_DESAS|nr:DUF3231 family protein [Desulfofarcimen acetoxidans]ACV63339.1 hypothetical protein Dtox_2537 [Desulfofarcimen acetoxidans DSM 771]